MNQLIFDLSLDPDHGPGSFHVSASNRAAAEMIARWPDWPGGIVCVAGPPGCGKSHLAGIWQAKAGAARLNAPLDLAAIMQAGPRAFLLEDVSGLLEETELFHLINGIRENEGSLLLTARLAPARWDARLPDLASRLRSLPVAVIEAPDDELLAALLLKQFSDRQIAVEKAVIGYLVPRMERSFDAAVRIVAELDALAMALKRPITVPLAKTLVMPQPQEDRTA